MATQLLHQFIINSVDVTSYVLAGTKIELSEKSNAGNIAEFVINPNVLSLITPIGGMSISYSRGVSSATESFKFRGQIKRIIQNDDSSWTLKCTDPLNKFKYDLFTKSYDRNIDTEAGELSAIATDIIEDGGLTANVTTSGTGVTDITVDKFISNNQTRLNRLGIIKKVLFYTLQYDYDNQWVDMAPKGSVLYPTTLEVGTNIFNVPVWEEDVEAVRNVVEIEGATELDTRIVNFSPDSVEDTFNFDFRPETTDCTIDGTLQVRGVNGSSESYDYTVDQDLKKFIFVTAPSGTAGIMSYTTKIPVPVEDSDSSSIALYNVTQKETFAFQDVVTTDDAATRAHQILSLLKDAPISTTLFTDEYNIKPGMQVNVVDSRRPDRSGTYNVDSVVINYPEPFDVIKVGTETFNVQEIFNNIDERIKLLEQTNNRIDAILRQLKSFSANHKLPNRYAMMEKGDLSDLSVWDGTDTDDLWGDDNAYQAGEALWGTDDEPPSERFLVVQGNNKYDEYFYDSDFEDTGATTATWGSNELSFTAAQVAQTLSLYLDGNGVGTIQSVTLQSTVESGTFTYEATSNGGDVSPTWEEISVGTVHNFATAGSDLRLRITESGTGGAGWPTVFGTWGSSTGAGWPTAFGTWGSTGGGTGTITNIKLLYE